MEKKRIKNDFEKVKDGVLDIAKDLVEQSIPTIIDGVKKIASGFADSFQYQLRKEISRKLDSKKSKQEEKKDDDSKRSDSN